MKPFIYILFFFFALPAFGLELPSSAQTGDLIFMNIDCGDFCQAVIDVTREQWGAGPDINHMGLLEVISPHEAYVFEALPGAGVVRTPIGEVFKRLQTKDAKRSISGRMMIGKIKPRFRPMFLQAVTEFRGILGRPYNRTFSYSSKGFYCSQAVQKMVFKANNRRYLWTWKPMSFGKPGSRGRSAWEEYFKQIRASVPEGEFGVSPLGMYLEGKGRFFD